MLEAVQSALKLNRVSVSAETLKATIRRFPYRLRNKIAKLAVNDDKFADLMRTSPVSAAKIASLPDKHPVRIEALQIVRAGERLAAVNKVLHVPMWMRRLPPEAFAAPLDVEFSHHWFGDQFGVRLLNAAPAEAERTGRWLQAVIEAEVAGGPEFALWVASLRVFTARRPPAMQIMPLALFHWYSTQSGLPGGQIVHAPWNDKMSVGRAAALTREWAIRSLQDFCLDPQLFKDNWCRPCIVGSVEVVPLITASSLCDEAMVLRNCLRRYVGTVAIGHSHIYSLRSGGNRIAAMEVRTSETTGLPRITQLCGPANSRPSQEAVDAATAWLMLQLREGEALPKLCPPRHSELLFQRDIWGPYERARRADIGDRFTLKPPLAADLLKELAALALLDRF